MKAEIEKQLIISQIKLLRDALIDQGFNSINLSDDMLDSVSDIQDLKFTLSSLEKTARSIPR